MPEAPPDKKTGHKVLWIIVGMPMVVVAMAGMLVATYVVKDEDLF
jgi:flagellar basal body-associated protein FliL